MWLHLNAEEAGKNYPSVSPGGKWNRLENNFPVSATSEEMQEKGEKFIDKDHQKCVDNFISAKMFGGKTFWEIENEIEWVD